MEGCTCPKEEPYYNHQLQTQDLFWTTTIKQYQDHIKSLQREKCETQYSINSIEGTMLPFITYLMIKLSTTRPNLDINLLLSSEITSLASTSSTSSCCPLPNLSILQNFTIQDNDVLYMDIIKSLAEETNRLHSNIDKLISQEDALMNTKNYVDNMFRVTSKAVPDKLVINGQVINALYERLANGNAALENEIVEERARNVALQQDIEDAFEKITREEQRNRNLQEALNNAGANIEIANVMTRGGEIDHELERIKEEITKMNATYSNLLLERNTLADEAMEIRSSYRKKMYQEFLPERLPEEHNEADEEDCVDSTTHNCLCPSGNSNN